MPPRLAETRTRGGEACVHDEVKAKREACKAARAEKLQGVFISYILRTYQNRFRRAAPKNLLTLLPRPFDPRPST